MNDAAQALGWMSTLFENTPSAILVVDPHGIVMLVNAAAVQLTGFDRSDLVGTSLSRILPPAGASQVATLHEHYSAGRPTEPTGLDGSLLLLRPDGVEVPVELSAASAGDEVAAYIVTLRDITDRRDAEEALRFSAQRLTEERQATEDLATYQRVLDRIARGEPRDSTLEELCREVEKRFSGAMCTVMLPQDLGDALYVAAAPSMPPAATQALAGLPIADGVGACGTAAATGQITIVEDTLTDSRTTIFLKLARRHNLRAVWSSPLYDTDGSLLGTFALYRTVPHTPDPAELKTIKAAAGLASLAIQRAETDRALREAAERDSLTGLPTRAVFLSRLSGMLAESDASVAVMFLDLDRFKWINDSIGHPSGDDILIAVAARLTQAVGNRGLLTRFGGDEFTVAVNPADRASTDALADRIEEAVARPLMVGGREFYLSVSIGIAFSEAHSDASGLVRDADAAMYAAKARGGSRRTFFDRRLRDRILQRVSRENELRRAIERDELTMEYQPLMRLGDGVRTGFEALVRWEHPRLGRLAPAEFIPLAEETGLILPLGAKVLDLVIRDTVQIAAALGEVRVGVNVSGIQLGDPNAAVLVEDTLKRHGLDPARLVIEVTETGFMEQFDLALSTLQRLVSFGVNIVIDDFGTGYSSIARMSEMPISGVKIDRAFTRNIGANEQAAAVLASITRLAHAFGLAVIAEGIESGVEYEVARELGCDFGQGFHIARPMPLSEVLELTPEP